MLARDKRSEMVKVNRGYQPSAVGHNRTAIALDGKVTFNAGQLQDKLQQIKSRTQCYDCGQKGHWRGDKSCPKSTSSSTSSKGGKKGSGKKGGRKGGFLQRAGMAAAMLASASGTAARIMPRCLEQFELVVHGGVP